VSLTIVEGDEPEEKTAIASINDTSEAKEQHARLFGVQEEEEEDDIRARGHMATSASAFSSNVAANIGLASTIVAAGLTGGLRSVDDTRTIRGPIPAVDDEDEEEEGEE
jgi:hypothetical protein